MLSINGPTSIGKGWQVYQVQGPQDWKPDARFQWSTSGQAIKHSWSEGDAFRFCVEEDAYTEGEVYLYCNVVEESTGTSANVSLKVAIETEPKEAEEPLVVDFTDNSVRGIFRARPDAKIILVPSANKHSRYDPTYDVIWTFDSEHRHIRAKHDFGPVEYPLEDFIDHLQGTPGYLNLTVKLAVTVFDCEDASEEKAYVIDVSEKMLRYLKNKRKIQFGGENG